MEQTILNILSNPVVLLFILLWTIPWKGAALWKAAKNGHKKWFIVLLVLNTIAILEITYIFYFSKPKQNVEQSDRRN
jgi:hypothetical protein